MRRLAIVRGNESRKRRRADPELHAAEFEVEVTTSIEVEEKEDPDAKWNINDIACFEDSRVGEPSKAFWESLAVVKSRRYHDSQEDSSFVHDHERSSRGIVQRCLRCRVAALGASSIWSHWLLLIWRK